VVSRMPMTAIDSPLNPQVLGSNPRGRTRSEQVSRIGTVTREYDVTTLRLVPEPVKRFEALSIHVFFATSSRSTGGLIHATSGSCGAACGRCRNRMGLAA
jgi:hypothetical protein